MDSIIERRVEEKLKKRIKVNLSREEAAEMMGISVSKLKLMISQREIPVVRIGDRVLISAKTIREHSENHESYSGSRPRKPKK